MLTNHAGIYLLLNLVNTENFAASISITNSCLQLDDELRCEWYQENRVPISCELSVSETSPVFWGNSLKC